MGPGGRRLRTLNAGVFLYTNYIRVLLVSKKLKC
jgi:hypothetical protein